jgi:hypothetical protein
MSVVTQLYFKIVEEYNYMFRPFSGWVTIRLRLEYFYGCTFMYNVFMRDFSLRPAGLLRSV